MNERKPFPWPPLIAVILVLLFVSFLIVPVHQALRARAEEDRPKSPPAFDFYLGDTPRSEIGQSAPDFEMENLDGSVTRLSRLIGAHSVIVLNFFATWCGPCREELPHLSAIGIDLESKGVLVVAVSSESPVVIKRFAGRKYPGVHFARDIGGLGQSAFGVDGIPTTFLITSDSTIQARFSGYAAGRENKVRARIQDLLGPSRGQAP